MAKEEQTIELVNPEINKVKVGTGIGLFIIALIVLLLSFSYSQTTEPLEIIFRFSSYLIGSIGGLLIGIGIGGQKYKSQWIKKERSEIFDA
ncbi:MAG: hypothetical protein ACFFCU_20265 [Promethearchaeota archaeon]